MVRNPCFQYKGDMSLIPGGRTKIPYALCCVSHVRLIATQWTIAHQAPRSIGFSRHSQKIILKKIFKKFVLQLLSQMINI